MADPRSKYTLSSGVRCEPAEFLREMKPGLCVGVLYAGSREWRELMLLGPAAGSSATVPGKWVCLGPAGDWPTVDFALGGGGSPTRACLFTPVGSCPAFLRGKVYRFAAYADDSEMLDKYGEVYRREVAKGTVTKPSHYVDDQGVVKALPQGWADAPGGGAVVPVVAAGAPAAGAAAAGPAAPASFPQTFNGRVLTGDLAAAATGGKWLVAEPGGGGLSIGTDAKLTAVDLVLDDSVALIHRGGEWLRAEFVKDAALAGYVATRKTALGVAAPAPAASAAAEADSRTLWVDTDPHGDRHKEWRNVVRESYAGTFHDWIVEGPAAALGLMKHWDRHGGDPEAWLSLWARDKKIDSNDRLMHELTAWIRMFRAGGSYDQLNLPCLASFEIAARRVVTLIEANNVTGRGPDYSVAKYLAGRPDVSDVVPRELRSWAVRLAREDADLRGNRPAGQAAGGGRGSGQEAARVRTADAAAEGGLPATPGDGGAAPTPAPGAGAGRGTRRRGLPRAP